MSYQHGTFEVGVVAQFEAAHRLHGDFGPATRTHGHTYRVEVAARGPSLRADGVLLDITVLQGAVQDAIRELHYRDLDEIPALRERNTTAEVMARYLFEQVAPCLSCENLTSLLVRVWESPQAYACYEDSLD